MPVRVRLPVLWRDGTTHNLLSPLTAAECVTRVEQRTGRRWLPYHLPRTRPWLGTIAARGFVVSSRFPLPPFDLETMRRQRLSVFSAMRADLEETSSGTLIRYRMEASFHVNLTCVAGSLVGPVVALCAWVGLSFPPVWSPTYEEARWRILAIAPSLLLFWSMVRFEGRRAYIVEQVVELVEGERITSSQADRLHRYAPHAMRPSEV